MGKKSDAPPPPDYSPIAAANQQSAQLSYDLGKQQLDWAKQTYADNKDTTDKVVNSFLQTQSDNDAAAKADRDRYTQKFQPLEDSLINDAQSYSTPERKDYEVGRAQATVAQQFEGARNAATQQLESYGVNPASTRFAALDVGTRTQEAAAKAAAGNQASMAVDATGRALRDDAINVGRGYPGQVAQEYGTAGNAGNGAVNDTLATTASGANTMGTATQWQGLGNQAINQWGNTLNQGYQNSLDAYKAQNQSSSGIGTMLGLVAGTGSNFLSGGTKPWIFAADGGAIPEEYTPGQTPNYGTGAPSGPSGSVPVSASPSRGQAIDDVSARLTPGEFVVPRDVVSWVGEDKLQKLIQQARQAKQGAVAKPQVRQANAPRGALPVG